jgi:hypothetical protein
VRCVSCDAVVDPIWRWCPECGSHVVFDPVAAEEAPSVVAMDTRLAQGTLTLYAT